MKDIHITWDAPTQHTDGSPVQPGDIDHYNLYSDQGVSGGPMVKIMERDAGLPTQVVLPNQAPATYHFQVTAVDSLLVESDLSNTAVDTVPEPPPRLNPPANLFAVNL